MIMHKSIVGLSLVLGLGAACAFGIAAETASTTSDGSCTHPATETQAAAVSVPDYAVETKDTPEQNATETAWRDYQKSVFDELSLSPDPRDWALATLTGTLMFDPTGQDRRDALLQRAAHAAPDDVLVQFIVANSSRVKTGAPAFANEAMQTLQRLEPDNAIVWLGGLHEAVSNNDNKATDAALARVAGAARFDEHSAEVLKAMVDVYTRYPVPDEYLALTKDALAAEKFPAARDFIPHTMALATVFAVVTPPYQDIIRECRIDPASSDNAVRADTCAAIGRLMASHSTTWVSTLIGYSVLRVSNTFNDDDVRRARDEDWLFKVLGESLNDSSDQVAADTVARDNDWIETGSEIEAARRSIARAGKSTEPPTDWVDDRSPFSAKRLQDSQILLTKWAGTH
ncbi:MAG: hypothetical protein P4L92_09205 [Rudaea sp.]|nr:hypothetical protein [Rudaea sp.]